MQRVRRFVGVSLLAGFLAAACGGTEIQVASEPGDTLSTTEAAPETTVGPEPTAAPETTDAPDTTTTNTPTTTAEPESTTSAAGGSEGTIAEFESTLSSFLRLSGAAETTAELDIPVLYAQGEAVCASLDRNNSLADAGGQYFVGSSVAVTGALIFTTIEVICPRHSSLTDDLIDAATGGTPEEQFIGSLRSLVSSEFVDEFGEQALIDLAVDACSRLDDGVSLIEIYTDLFTLDASRLEELGAAVGVGIGLFCPEYLGELEDLADLAGTLDG